MGTRCKVRCNGVATEERTPVVYDRPSYPGADFLRVRVPNGETLFAIQDVVEFEELPVVISLLPEYSK